METPAPLSGCMSWWVVEWIVGYWVDSYWITRNQINLGLPMIILFCLKIYGVMETFWPMGWCMGGWLDGWIGWVYRWVMSNHKIQKNLDIIEIIQFCLHIYDLWRYLYSNLDVSLAIIVFVFFSVPMFISSNHW